MSGWEASSTTIFAPRRARPPERIVAAHASVVRMNDTGRLASPPRETGSREERIGERLIPAPPPCWKISPSRVFQSSSCAIESATLRMKHAEVSGRSASPAFSDTGVANVARCMSTNATSSSRSTRR